MKRLLVVLTLFAFNAFGQGTKADYQRALSINPHLDGIREAIGELKRET